MAVIIHVIVLSQFSKLIQQPVPHQQTSPLQIRLSQLQPAVKVVMEEPSRIVPPPTRVEPMPRTLPQTAELSPPDPVSVSPAAETLINESRDAARIVAHLPSESAPAFIGRQQSPVPRNWSQPVIPLADNRFSGMWLAQIAQVLDQWQNRDGSQQNKIRLPNGKLVCGKKAASELFEPLVIPIWTYQGC